MSAARVRSYAAKAREFADAAANSLEAGHNITATSLAVHAGISAADAVCGARMGQRAAGEDHNQALKLLRQAGRDGAEIEHELRRLPPLETGAEYTPDSIAISVAVRTVARAQRCSTIAQRVAATTR